MSGSSCRFIMARAIQDCGHRLPAALGNISHSRSKEGQENDSCYGGYVYDGEGVRVAAFGRLL